MVVRPYTISYPTRSREIIKNTWGISKRPYAQQSAKRIGEVRGGIFPKNKGNNSCKEITIRNAEAKLLQ